MERDPSIIPPNDACQKMALINYWLYLASFITGGLTGIIGVIIAYVYRNDAKGTYLESHYTFQIRTFWISLLYGFIAVLLTVILIGVLLGFAVAIWYIIRCVKGLKAINEQRPVDNVNTWLI